MWCMLEKCCAYGTHAPFRTGTPSFLSLSLGCFYLCLILCAPNFKLKVVRNIKVIIPQLTKFIPPKFPKSLAFAGHSMRIEPLVYCPGVLWVSRICSCGFPSMSHHYPFVIPPTANIGHPPTWQVPYPIASSSLGHLSVARLEGHSDLQALHCSSLIHWFLASHLPHQLLYFTFNVGHKCNFAYK